VGSGPLFHAAGGCVCDGPGRFSPRLFGKVGAHPQATTFLSASKPGGRRSCFERGHGPGHVFSRAVKPVPRPSDPARLGAGGANPTARRASGKNLRGATWGRPRLRDRDVDKASRNPPPRGGCRPDFPREADRRPRRWRVPPSNMPRGAWSRRGGKRSPTPRSGTPEALGAPGGDMAARKPDWGRRRKGGGSSAAWRASHSVLRKPVGGGTQRRPSRPTGPPRGLHGGHPTRLIPPPPPRKNNGAGVQITGGRGRGPRRTSPELRPGAGRPPGITGGKPRAHARERRSGLSSHHVDPCAGGGPRARSPPLGGGQKGGGGPDAGVGSSFPVAGHRETHPGGEIPPGSPGGSNSRRLGRLHPSALESLLENRTAFAGDLRRGRKPEPPAWQAEPGGDIPRVAGGGPKPRLGETCSARWGGGGPCRARGNGARGPAGLVPGRGRGPLRGQYWGGLAYGVGEGFRPFIRAGDRGAANRGRGQGCETNGGREIEGATGAGRGELRWIRAFFPMGGQKEKNVGGPGGGGPGRTGGHKSVGRLNFTGPGAGRPGGGGGPRGKGKLAEGLGAVLLRLRGSGRRVRSFPASKWRVGIES